MIKRYDLWYGKDYSDSLRHGADEAEDGKYVLYEDYKELKEMLDQMIKKVYEVKT